MTLLRPLRLIEGSRQGFADLSFSAHAQGSGEEGEEVGLVRRLEIYLGRAVRAVQKAVHEGVVFVAGIG